MMVAGFRECVVLETDKWVVRVALRVPEEVV